MLRGGTPTDVHPFSQTFATMPSVVVFYARHLFWPVGLSPFYGLFLRDKVNVGALAITVVIAVVLVALALRSKTFLIAVCWIVLPVLPALAGLRVFDRTDVVHDRYLYFSTIGLGILIGVGISHLRSDGSQIFGIPALRFAFAAALILAMVAGTTREMRPWLNNLTLFVRGVQIAPQSPPAYNHLAFEIFKRGNPVAAQELYEKAIALDPEDWGSNFGLAVLDMRTGQLNNADQRFERAIMLQPQATNAVYVLQAQVRLQAGRAPDAEESIRKAIAIWPANLSQHLLLAQILLAERKPDEAKAEFQRELVLNPSSSDARTGLESLLGR
jgi:Tfp pilus assembly protein PilF